MRLRTFPATLLLSLFPVILFVAGCSDYSGDLPTLPSEDAAAPVDAAGKSDGGEAGTSLDAGEASDAFGVADVLAFEDAGADGASNAADSTVNGDD